MSWISYSEKKKRIHDFEVTYKFIAPEDGGRSTGLPVQGYRCDFLYEGDDPLKDGIWMIWPEFEDDQKKIIRDVKAPVSAEGIARMWVVNDMMREENHRKLSLGGKGFFVEGHRKVAVCEIIKINEIKK